MFSRTMKATVVGLVCMGALLGARGRSHRGDADVIVQDQVMFVDDAVYSSDGTFVLTYQADGNLVLYDLTQPDKVTPLWATNTNDGNPGFAVLQLDGNFVTYNGDGRATWASGTTGLDDNVLWVQNDGNFVMYSNNFTKVPWATGTNVGGGHH